MATAKIEDRILTRSAPVISGAGSTCRKSFLDLFLQNILLSMEVLAERVASSEELYIRSYILSLVEHNKA